MNLLQNLRTLLLAFPNITDRVDDRIRPHRAHSSDGAADVLILELSDGEQNNVLDQSGGPVNALVNCVARSTDRGDAEALIEAVRDGLDGYRGPAGTGELIQCERTDLSTSADDDDDADDDGFYWSDNAFSVWYVAG